QPAVPRRREAPHLPQPPDLFREVLSTARRPAVPPGARAAGAARPPRVSAAIVTSCGPFRSDRQQDWSPSLFCGSLAEKSREAVGAEARSCEALDAVTRAHRRVRGAALRAAGVEARSG